MNSDFNAGDDAPAAAAKGSTAHRWAALQKKWQAVSARERRLVVFATALVALALLWFAALQPALQTLKKAPAEKARLDMQLAEMRSLAQEASQLKTAPALGPDQAAAALKAATDRLGAAAKLSLQGERAVVTLEGLDPAQLGPWLEDVRTGARARPVEANLSRAAAGFSGTVVLALGGKP